MIETEADEAKGTDAKDDHLEDDPVGVPEPLLRVFSSAAGQGSESASSLQWWSRGGR